MDVLVVESTVRMASSGKNFVEMTVISEHGDTFRKCKIWDSDKAPEGAIHILGKIDLFNGNFQIVVSDYESSARDIEKFYPRCPWDLDVDYLKERFHDLVATIKDPGLRRFVTGFIDYAGVLESFCGDPVDDQYFVHPGGRMIHHNYAHGLLEHSIEVATHGLNAARVHGLNQRELNLVIAGGLIHDVGKVLEIELHNGGYILSERAKMYGWNSSAHLYIGHTLLVMYHEKQENLIFMQDLNILENVILSHHGPYGHVKPASMVAEIVHQSDMMSSRINRMKQNLLLSDGDVESDQTRDSYIQVVGTES